VITERATDRIIGMMGLGSIDRHDRSAELYYWITPSEWGKGYATEASRAVLRIAFGRMALHRVSAHVHTFNTASLRVLRKLGFRKEGRLREVRRVGRRWHDAWVMGLLKSEFRERQDVRNGPRREPVVQRERNPPGR
jgi:[ribosomal protein S5]-alanine N-acetyltransferase